MPKIFGSSLLAIVIAAVVFYMVGFLIFGVLFGELWLEQVGMTEEEALARNAQLGAMMFVWGFVMPLIQVVGLAWIMNHVGASDIGTSIKVGATIAVFIALPILGYNWVYEGRAAGAVGLDFVHLLVGYVVSCAILGFFRGRD
ncbi:DUF1761 family protein [Erythrobacter sp. Alg231-14]|uniref:DUF1761 family protein n=1 Tax=Erythrobacter sp. Alg231-14 TaxID=1922225 RepID=UPI000D555952